MNASFQPFVRPLFPSFAQSDAFPSLKTNLIDFCSNGIFIKCKRKNEIDTNSRSLIFFVKRFSIVAWITFVPSRNILFFSSLHSLAIFLVFS